MSSADKYAKWTNYCKNAANSRVIDDLFNPLRLYGENFRKGFCVIIDNSPDNKLALTDYGINNTTDFDNAIKKYKEPVVFYNTSNLYITIPALFDSSNISLTNYTGYNVDDPIVKIDQTGIQTIKLPITDPYGRCKQNRDIVRFLKNKKMTCSYKMTMSYDSCSRFNVNLFLKNLTSYIAGYDNNTSTVLKIDPTTAYYYITDDMYYQQITRSSLSTTMGIISTGCVCPNLIKKVKINVMMQNNTIQNIQVNYYVEDVKDACGATHYVPVTYEVEYTGNNQVILFYLD